MGQTCNQYSDSVCQLLRDLHPHVYDTCTQRSPLHTADLFIRWTSYTPCTMSLLYKPQSLTVNVFDVSFAAKATFAYTYIDTFYVPLSLYVLIHFQHFCISMPNTWTMAISLRRQKTKFHIFPLTTNWFKEKDHNRIR